MIATYADDESTNCIGAEERKATTTTTRTCVLSEEPCSETSFLAAGSTNGDQETSGTEIDAHRSEESIAKTMRNDEDVPASPVLGSKVRSDGSLMENVDCEGKIEQDKKEEKVTGAKAVEEDVEQVSTTTKIGGNETQGKFSNETDLPTRGELSKEETSSHVETIESDEGSVEDLRRSILKELHVTDDTKRYSPKKVIITCETFESTTDNTAIRVVNDDENAEKKGQQVEIEDYSKDEFYDSENEVDIHEAVRAGDAKRVAMLLASGRVRNLNEPDWNVSSDPPLLVAATNHDLPIVNMLLANGCNPAVRSSLGATALHRAVILNGEPKNVLNLVRELLKYGCPAGVKEAVNWFTPLHALTRQLTRALSSKILHRDFDAALKALELLAKAGPINAKNHEGRSALHILASCTTFDNNHKTEIESLIQILLGAGADPALKNDYGKTPLHECLECGALNTAAFLIPHTPPGTTSFYGETPLHIAAKKNYVDMVAKLLEHGESPSLQDHGGNTPLHLASARGFHQTVSLLVTSPLAQLEKINQDGLTALQVASESGFINAVTVLLKAGADPSQAVPYCLSTLRRFPDILNLINHELMRRRQLAA